jgi:hypothetical protein
MNLHPNDAFRAIIASVLAPRIAASRKAIADVVLIGEEGGLSEKRAEYMRLRDFEASVEWQAPSAPTLEAAAALVAQWPVDFPPLPLWFRDPAEATRLDPPGPPCVVMCGEAAE